MSFVNMELDTLQEILRKSKMKKIKRIKIIMENSRKEVERERETKANNEKKNNSFYINFCEYVSL